MVRHVFGSFEGAAFFALLWLFLLAFVFVMRRGCDFLTNASLGEFLAAHTAENESS